MALTNLILTVAGISAVILLMRSDAKQSASIFKRNVTGSKKNLHPLLKIKYLILGVIFAVAFIDILHTLWRHQSASAAEEVEKAKPKELPKKDIPKDN